MASTYEHSVTLSGFLPMFYSGRGVETHRFSNAAPLGLIQFKTIGIKSITITENALGRGTGPARLPSKTMQCQPHSVPLAL